MDNHDTYLDLDEANVSKQDPKATDIMISQFNPDTFSQLKASDESQEEEVKM